MLEEALEVEMLDMETVRSCDPKKLQAGRWAPLADGRVVVAAPYKPLLEPALADQKRCIVPGREIDRVLDTVFPEQDEGINARRLGRLLIDEGMVTEKELVEALNEQKRSGKRLGEVLTAHAAADAKPASRPSRLRL